ncbi:DUF397 domain-containing protein [Actinacidiphila bryophytorum]|uniref:DUF397 domain-containing protein n=1 Tax=Actinacidiphila bryophytorum TaxID=1436133 RepID=UPI002176ECF7|nr:DUF397 domain-containing protein [Actinacidiphila bryophytorum]UWE11550.1 DUF397 domain-containing protein [Actinacidiphila bryophytorum]
MTAQTTWRKSSYSGGDNGSCVEVAEGLAGVVPVRDSKDPQGPALVFPTAAWSAFLTDVKAGHFPS